MFGLVLVVVKGLQFMAGHDVGCVDVSVLIGLHVHGSLSVMCALLVHRADVKHCLWHWL